MGSQDGYKNRENQIKNPLLTLDVKLTAASFCIAAVHSKLAVVRLGRMM